MIGMAASLGSKVTVEGVETVDQVSILSDMGCDELQGFYFSKPLTADELVEYDLSEESVASSEAQKIITNYGHHPEADKLAS